MITEVPLSCSIKDITSTMETLFPKQVHRVYRVENVPEISKKVQEREETLQNIEKVEWEYDVKGTRSTVRSKIIIGQKIDAHQYYNDELAKIENWIIEKYDSANPKLHLRKNFLSVNIHIYFFRNFQEFS